MYHYIPDPRIPPDPAESLVPVRPPKGCALSERRRWLSPYARLQPFPFSGLLPGDEVEFIVRLPYTSLDKTSKQWRDVRGRGELDNLVGVAVEFYGRAYVYVPKNGYIYHPMMLHVRRVWRDDIVVFSIARVLGSPRPPSVYPFLDPLVPGYNMPTPAEIPLRTGDVVEYTVERKGRRGQIRGTMVNATQMEYGRVYNTRSNSTVTALASIHSNPITRVWRDGELLAQVKTMAWAKVLGEPYPDPTPHYATVPPETLDPVRDEETLNRAMKKKLLKQEAQRQRDRYWAKLSDEEVRALNHGHVPYRRPDGTFVSGWTTPMGRITSEGLTE